MTKSIPRFALSALVSVSTMLLDFTLFAICFALWSSAGATLLLARWACSALGALANFVLNRKLAFKPSARAIVELQRYAIVAAGAVTLATCVWSLLARTTALDPRILHPLSAAVVWLLFTYPLLKRWVFAQPA